MTEFEELLNTLRSHIDGLQKAINSLQPEDIANLKTAETELEAIYERRGILKRDITSLYGRIGPWTNQSNKQR